MSSIFSNASNPYLDDYSSDKSLIDLKLEELKNKVNTKFSKISSTPSIEDITAKYNLSGGSGLLDLAESSAYQEKENIGNFLTGQSNPDRVAEADALAGFTGREELQGKQSNIVDDLAQARINFSEDNYSQGLANLGKGAYNTLKIAPELLADSAGTFVSGLVGVGLTAIPEAASSAVGVGVLGKKAKSIADTVSNVADSIDKAEERIKQGKKVNVLEKAVKATAKATSQTSLMTASILQEMKEDYIQENNTTPSASWYAVNAPVAIALNTIQLGVFKKIFLPSKKGIKKDINATRQYVKEMKQILDPVPKKYRNQVAKRVLGHATKIAAAGGMEAGQEYLQTWHEILSTKMDKATLDSAVSEFMTGSNQDKALFGLLAGGAAGGLAKGAVSTPVIAAGVATDITLGATQKVAKPIIDKSIEASYSVLSKEERQKLSIKLEEDRKIHSEFSKIKNAQIENLKTASTISDITEQEVLKDIELARKELGFTDKDIEDPTKFKQVTNKVQRKYKSAIELGKAKIEGSNIARAVNLSSKNISNSVVKAAKKVKLDKAIEIAKTISEAAVDTVTNFNSSAAVDVLETAINYSINSTKEQTKKLKQFAQETSLNDLTETVKILKNKNTYAADVLNKIVAAKESAANRFGINKIEINKDNIPSSITSTIKDNRLDNLSSLVLSKDLRTILDSRIKDKETIEAIEKAVEIYKQSDFFKEQKENSLSDTDIEILQDKLAKRKNKLTIPQKIKNKTTNLAKKVTDEVVTKSKNNLTDRANKALIKKSKDKLKDLENRLLENNKDSANVQDVVSSTLLLFGIDPEGKADTKYVESIIKKGIQSKEQFAEFFNDSAPELAKFKVGKNTLLDSLSKKVFEVELEKFNSKKEEQKNSKETDDKEITDAEKEEELSQIEHYLNDNDEVATQDVNDITDKQFDEVLEDTGLLNKKCKV